MKKLTINILSYFHISTIPCRIYLKYRLSLDQQKYLFESKSEHCNLLVCDCVEQSLDNFARKPEINIQIFTKGAFLMTSRKEKEGLFATQAHKA